MLMRPWADPARPRSAAFMSLRSSSLRSRASSGFTLHPRCAGAPKGGPTLARPLVAARSNVERLRMPVQEHLHRVHVAWCADQLARLGRTLTHPVAQVEED